MSSNFSVNKAIVNLIRLLLVPSSLKEISSGAKEIKIPFIKDRPISFKETSLYG
jgi:hypothetical protein